MRTERYYQGVHLNRIRFMSIWATLAAQVSAEAVPPIAVVRTGSGNTGQQYGWSIAARQDLVVAGPAATLAPYVLIYTRTGSFSWNGFSVQPPNPSQNNGFGKHVATDGETIAVAATSSKRVFLYSRNRSLLQTINSPGDNYFAALAGATGHVLGISGDTLLVGAPDANTATGSLGKVYVFTRDQGTWSLETVWVNSDPNNTLFGHAVAIDGDEAAIGSPNGSGAVKFYHRDIGGTWSLVTTDTNCGGTATAISGNLAVVGHPGSAGPGGEYAVGKAFVYAKSGNSWVRTHTLTPDQTTPNLNYGIGVGASDDSGIIAVGAPIASVNGVLSGAIYVYRRDNSDWNLESKMNHIAPAFNDRLGKAVAVDGLSVFGGAYNDTVGSSTEAGSAFAFRFPGKEIRWINASGGDWGLGANWQTGTTPQSHDDPIFDLNGGVYVVDVFNDVTVNHLQVDRDNARLNLGSGTIGLTADMISVGSHFGGPTNFTIANGLIFVPSEISVGKTTGSAAALRIIDGTLLAGNVILGDTGGVGLGALHIEGGDVHVDSLHAAYGTGSEGVVTVQSYTGELTCATPMLIGENGTGSLTLFGGASGEALNSLVLGKSPGAVGNMTVDGSGAGPNDFTEFTIDGQFVIGDDGNGHVTVTNGGRLFTESVVFVGFDDSANTNEVHIVNGGVFGLAVLDGSMASDLVLANDTLTNAVMSVESNSAAAFSSALLSSGDGSHSTLTLDAGSLTLTEERLGGTPRYSLLSDGTGTSEIMVRNHAMLTAKSAYLTGKFSPATAAIVRVKDPATEFNIERSLVVGMEGDGQVIVTDSAKLKAGRIHVGPYGRVEVPRIIVGHSGIPRPGGPVPDAEISTDALDIEPGAVFVINECVILDNAEFGGTGTVPFTLLNTGVVRPGAADTIGTLNASQGYSQSPTARLEIEIKEDDNNPGSWLADQLAVTGTATLDGTLRMLLLDGAAPGVGTQWTVLTAGAVSGQFSQVTGDGRFVAAYFADHVEVTYLGILYAGDMNQNGSVDAGDTSLFVAALLDPVSYSGSDLWLADMSNDGWVDGDDLPLFVGAILN